MGSAVEEASSRAATTILTSQSLHHVPRIAPIEKPDANAPPIEALRQET